MRLSEFYLHDGEPIQEDTSGLPDLYEVFGLCENIDPKTPYVVVDSQTKQVIYKTTYSNRGKARAFADKKDLAYGAVRYIPTVDWEAAKQMGATSPSSDTNIKPEGIQEDFDLEEGPYDDEINKHPGHDPVPIGTNVKKSQAGADAAAQFLAAKNAGKPTSSVPSIPRGPTRPTGPTTAGSSKQDIWQATQDILKGKGGDSALVNRLGNATAMRRGDSAWKEAEAELERQRKQAASDLANKWKTAPGTTAKPKVPGVPKTAAPIAPVPPGTSAAINKAAAAKPAPPSPWDKFLPKKK